MCGVVVVNNCCACGTMVTQQSGAETRLGFEDRWVVRVVVFTCVAAFVAVVDARACFPQAVILAFSIVIRSVFCSV